MKKIKIFTLKFTQNGFDDSSLVQFLEDKELISLQEHFFSQDNLPYWAIMLIYQEPKPTAITRPPKTQTSSQTLAEEKSLLSDKGQTLLKTLKQWRLQTSKEEGIPPYLIFTNKQLHEICLKQPITLAQLDTIQGVGESKLRKYGQSILNCIQGKNQHASP